MIISQREIDKALIPKGQYCYSSNNGHYKICKYWKVISDRPHQYNGWCNYLETGDLEIAKDTTITNYKTGEKINGSDAPFPVSLLWDQCKECDINLNQ